MRNLAIDGFLFLSNELQGLRANTADIKKAARCDPGGFLRFGVWNRFLRIFKNTSCRRHRS
ncbi:hypothetical protein RMS29_027460 (plasmid) [Agrobacterium rosae]|uniref:hypothetical protein n=1 Tax=Agrobacterium TaxID=357 RepID=UPI002A0D1946|nr:hypothetical protein [Agrobacterium sp. rho-13.3]MDX8311438.1 hypothetical protein [Agrobacterium sp. rho-13.3]